MITHLDSSAEWVNSWIEKKMQEVELKWLSFLALHFYHDTNAGWLTRELTNSNSRPSRCHLAAEIITHLFNVSRRYRTGSEFCWGKYLIFNSTKAQPIFVITAPKMDWFLVLGIVLLFWQTLLNSIGVAVPKTCKDSFIRFFVHMLCQTGRIGSAAASRVQISLECIVAERERERCRGQVVVDLLTETQRQRFRSISWLQRRLPSSGPDFSIMILSLTSRKWHFTRFQYIPIFHFENWRQKFDFFQSTYTAPTIRQWQSCSRPPWATSSSICMSRKDQNVRPITRFNPTMWMNI